jgi:hypothetical protein
VFFLREEGARLGLAVEEGERLGFVMNLPVTHIPFSVGVSSQTCKKQAPLKCVCPRSVSFFGKRGVRLGLVVEGEGGQLGLDFLMICLRLHTLFSIGVSS